MDAAAGGAVPETDIFILIFGHARHPAIGSVGSERSLLIQGYRAGGIVISYQRTATSLPLATAWSRRPIVIGKTPDGKAVHQAVAQTVQVCVVPSCGTQVPPSLQARLSFATLIVVGAESVLVPAAS